VVVFNGLFIAHFITTLIIIESSRFIVKDFMRGALSLRRKNEEGFSLFLCTPLAKHIMV